MERKLGWWPRPLSWANIAGVMVLSESADKVLAERGRPGWKRAPMTLRAGSLAPSSPVGVDFVLLAMARPRLYPRVVREAATERALSILAGR